LRKQQVEAGGIVLLNGDESEALTHPHLARAWAKAGGGPAGAGAEQAKKILMRASITLHASLSRTKGRPNKRKS
jgi:hypothetical protein